MKPDYRNNLTAIPCIENLNLSGKAMGELIMEFTKLGKSIKIRAKGHSMFPLIKDGDIITIAPYDHISPELGDISVFFNPVTKRLTIHRLVGENHKKYLAKGDRCFRNDGYQMRSRLIGYVANIRNASLRNELIRHSKAKKIIRLLSIINVTYCVGSIWRCIRPAKKANRAESYRIIICLNAINLILLLA